MTQTQTQPTRASALAGNVNAITANLSPAVAAILAAAKDARDLDGRYEYTVDIDRDLAGLLLEHRDDCQRRVARGRVQEIRTDIEDNNWMNTGDVIRLSPEGTTVDGQHRLTAYVQANVDKSFILKDMTVVILKNRRALDVVDIGKSRTIRDLRKMTGRQELPQKAIGGILFEFMDFETRTNLSKIQRNQIVDNYPFFDEAIQLATHRAGVKMSSTPVIAAALRCMKVPGAQDIAFKFFNAVLQNEHSVDGNPVSQLRLLANWLINNHHNGGGHAIRRETVARCIHAWNAYREGRDIKYIRYHKSSGIPTPK